MAARKQGLTLVLGAEGDEDSSAQEDKSDHLPCDDCKHIILKNVCSAT